MSKESRDNTDIGLSKSLSERERRTSRRAFIVMSVLLTIGSALLAPRTILGVYAVKLGISGEQLGALMAWLAPFGLAGLLLAKLVNKIGRKRMLGWGILPAGLFTAMLIILPYVKENWGLGLTLLVLWVILASKRISECFIGVPWFPMIQTITLPSRRGAFLGRMRLTWGLALVVVTFGVARLIGKEAEISLLMVLIVLLGVVYWLMFWPLRSVVEHRTQIRPKALNWSEAWPVIRKNPLSIRATVASGLTWFGLSIFNIFQFHFLKENLGWADSTALDMVWVFFLGSALSNVFWGAVADRLGDRAVAQLAFLGMVASAMCWLAAGNNEPGAICLVVIGSFGLGIFQAGAMMSNTRVVLNHIPERVSPALMALRTVSITLAMSAAGWLGSVVLRLLKPWKITTSGNWLILDPYKILFLVAVLVWLFLIWLCRKFPGEAGRTPWTVLAAMFNRPFQTVWMISRIDDALPEHGRLNLVHKLARMDSPLAYEGLLSGLRDASYDVRLVSVNALASRAEPQSYKALLEILDQPELDIQPEAAWALGELGDRRAVDKLIKALQADNQLLRGRSARALGKLDAHQAVPALQKMLIEDAESFVRRSAAIALSRMNVRESLTAVFDQFRLAKTRLAQRELALALANLVHGGDLYYQIRRHETQGLAAVLQEAVDEALAEEPQPQEARLCFEQMIEALQTEDLEAVRAIAAKAIAQTSLHLPSGNAGELTDYLLSRETAQPWAQEQAALLIFLLLQESKHRKGLPGY